MFRASSLIRQDREFRAAVQTLENEFSKTESLPIVVNGLGGGARDAFLVETLTEAKRVAASPSVILAGNDEECIRIRDLLRNFGFDALYYKQRELVFHNISASHSIDRERLSALYRVARGECDCVVCTPAASLGLTMPRERLLSDSLTLCTSDEISPDGLCKRLEALGFSFSDTVEGKGQFSKRGGIIDFWGTSMDEPVRVEFFGDEIDRMVSFDPITQRSASVCEKIELLPAKEVVCDAESRNRILGEIEILLANKKLSDEMRCKLRSEYECCKSGLPIDFADKYLGVIYEEYDCLLDYLSAQKSFAFVIGSNECRENAKAAVEKMNNAAEGMLSYYAVTKRAAKYIKPIEDYDSYLQGNMTVHLNPFAGGVGNMKLAGLFGFRSRNTVCYGNNPTMLFEDLRGLAKGGYTAVILCPNAQGRDSLLRELTDAGFAPALTDREELDGKRTGGEIFLAIGDFTGFDLITPRIALLSMRQDSGKSVMANKRRQRMRSRLEGAGKRLMSYAELEVGDYVVHANYGIGLFEGLQSVTVDGVTKDYITIKYDGTDRLLIPCDRLEAVGKYIGDRDKDGTVKLSKMGGTEWTKAKNRAKGAAKDIAQKLIALYAERQRTPGFAFPAQTEMEDEFDADFEYMETESQLEAIEEIKNDMMRPVPMNRLLCGDVGFGKTEVALRAAFKCVVGGKQVAILVPTTILAMQHYQTALSRMRGYAVNVEMLSRFKKPKERAEILERTKRGEVDILIGTHALISKKVEFSDLGLLVIDEEQRFGVAQKEKLREMAKNVDTLMLSATPIPRTLNMAMSGISDISVLDEAPGERHPVETYVLEHDNGIIADAIQKELSRRGQVLYLYNKVEDIDIVAGRLAEALPEARIAYAHGQMEKEELEDIWQFLVRGELDVLVCTTIIETGVDLPNANTLIIENADRFGLSQLHQIRGRVGRSERQAYAYLTYRPGKSLSEVAQKRLETIREFAEFGAGFKIALRDMEIRGVGNLLGAEQHGYIESVGYNLYLKLLNDAVIEQRGDKPERAFEAVIKINLSAHIPEYYVASSSARMEMYKKISHVSSAEDASEILDEFIDRFGEPPRQVERLINVSLAKAEAEKARISRVEYEGGKLFFACEKPRLDVWSELFAKFPRLSFSSAAGSGITYRLNRGEDPTVLAAEILTEYNRHTDGADENN